MLRNGRSAIAGPVIIYGTLAGVAYGLVLSALGVLTPVTGALWHNCGSVFVVVNAALLLRLKDT